MQVIVVTRLRLSDPALMEAFVGSEPHLTTMDRLDGSLTRSTHGCGSARGEDAELTAVGGAEDRLQVCPGSLVRADDGQLRGRDRLPRRPAGCRHCGSSPTSPSTDSRMRSA